VSLGAQPCLFACNSAARPIILGEKKQLARPAFDRIIEGLSLDMGLVAAFINNSACELCCVALCCIVLCGMGRGRESWRGPSRGLLARAGTRVQLQPVS
jgi:hypothetical protein